MGLAATVFIINAILKFLPDGIMPFGLGPDSAYDRMMEAKKTDVGGNDENAAANDDAEKGTSINWGKVSSLINSKNPEHLYYLIWWVYFQANF